MRQGTLMQLLISGSAGTELCLDFWAAGQQTGQLTGLDQNLFPCSLPLTPERSCWPIEACAASVGG